jgi:hypothetical protein
MLDNVRERIAHAAPLIAGTAAASEFKSIPTL